MKPLYVQIKKNHYSSNESSPDFVPRSTLFSEIGYSESELLKANPGYQNTCAIRMSLALLKCNVSFQGRLLVKTGDYKGKK